MCNGVWRTTGESNHSDCKNLKCISIFDWTRAVCGRETSHSPPQIKTFWFQRPLFYIWLTTKQLSLTHAYVHWLADVHFAGFAPANRQMPIASVVMRQCKKNDRQTWHSKTWKYRKNITMVVNMFFNNFITIRFR